MTIFTVQTSMVQLTEINNSKELADNEMEVQCFNSKEKAVRYLRKTLQNIVADLKDWSEEMESQSVTLEIGSENPKHCCKTETEIDTVSVPAWDIDEYRVETVDGMNMWEGRIDEFIAGA
ncbi:MAG: hypothetical protein ACI4CC_01485 [Lachnospiraceae bacterium]